MLKKLIALVLILSIFIPFGVFKAEGQNLVPEGSSKMSPAGEKRDENDSGWIIFGSGGIGVFDTVTKDGKKETALKAVDLGENTWSSPYYDIYSVIASDISKNGAGRYAISFDFMLEGEAGKEYELAMIVRASNKTELFTDGNGGEAGYRKNIGNPTGTSGKWRNFTTTIGVRPEDLSPGATWKLCFDRKPADLTTIWVDDFSIIRVSDDSSPTVQNAVCVDSSKYGSVAITNKDETVEKGANLLDEMTSTFSGVKDWQQTKWKGFSAGAMSISEEGYNGPCIKMKTPQNTWGSPALDIFPMITEPGEYTFSVFAKYDGEGEKKLSLILRGTKKTTVIEQQGTNFFGQLCSKTLKAGQWEKMTATFKVTEEDLLGEDSWKVCYSSISADIEAVYFDEAVLIKGDVNDLPEEPTPNENIQQELEEEEKEETPLYDPNIKKAAIITAIVTAIIVVHVVLFKILMYIHKNRKGAKK